jgi:hypothetical protein
LLAGEGKLDLDLLGGREGVSIRLSAIVHGVWPETTSPTRKRGTTSPTRKRGTMHTVVGTKCGSIRQRLPRLRVGLVET